MSIMEALKNGLAVAGPNWSVKRNGDAVFTGRRKPYYSDSQNKIAVRYGNYASNAYDAMLQGWDPEDFYAFWPVKLRCMDVSRETTGSNLSDDIKSIVVYYPEGVDYIPIGAHVTFAGNTWLVTNPANVNAILSEAIIRRCNAVYKRLDWYGNVLTCPFNLPKMQARGAQDEYTKNMILADNYYACTMQLNEVSAEIHENTRLILGDAAYSVRGLNNFSQAFTGEEDSVHILYFQIQREEAVSVYDDMDRKIADGLAFSWSIDLTASVSMHAGQTQTIAPVSVRNGQTVSSTAENPFSYLWESSDNAVLTVDENGNVTALGEGTAAVTCTLAENPEIARTVQIEVHAGEADYVAFSGALPGAVAEQQTVRLEARYYENGAETEEPVAFSFSGPEAWRYTAETDGNAVTVTCWERSDTPLTVTASANGHTAAHNLALTAW